MLPDFERADRIGEFWGNPKTRTFAELLIDCEEDRTLRAVLDTVHLGQPKNSSIKGRPAGSLPFRSNSANAARAASAASSETPAARRPPRASSASSRGTRGSALRRACRRPPGRAGALRRAPLVPTGPTPGRSARWPAWPGRHRPPWCARSSRARPPRRTGPDGQSARARNAAEVEPMSSVAEALIDLSLVLACRNESAPPPRGLPPWVSISPPTS